VVGRPVEPEARSLARERLRTHYRPDRVRILFVGESPPASGRFFYQADSGLYRAVRETFHTALPSLRKAEFLDSFCALGCYLVDLCREPVDKMTRDVRRCACCSGEARLARTIRTLRPEIIITVVRSIGENVTRAREQAAWSGPHLELPYPGRWQRARLRFSRKLVPLLRKTVGEIKSLPHHSPPAKERSPGARPKTRSAVHYYVDSPSTRNGHVAIVDPHGPRPSILEREACRRENLRAATPGGSISATVGTTSHLTPSPRSRNRHFRQ
jgi:hypothetical protein